jgi:glucokinase
MILAGDIGGTKTVLALFDSSPEGLQEVCSETYASQTYPSLQAILETFLASSPALTLQAACFGVAGPVLGGKCVTTNLPWTLEATALARMLRAPRVLLLNDLEAAAYGMLFLPPEAFDVLHPGAQPSRQGNIGVIAAGTGLGEAMLYWDGRRFHPVATEGGHASFAPGTDLEIDLLRDLQARFGGHVSCERVLSGPGLANIYAFLRRREGTPEPNWLKSEFRQADPSPIISRHGLAGSEPVCVAALELFVSIYGAEAGNLALKCMAVGGVCLGGGIAPQLLPALHQGRFMDRFTDKGRLASLLATIEVKVVLNPHAPLIGAAYFAIRA